MDEAREHRDRRSFLKKSAALFGASLVAPFAGSRIAGAWSGHAENAPDDGWATIFNGEDLDGWHVNPEKIWHGTGGRWRVEDGMIVGEQDPPGSGNGGILLTDAQFGDFELMLDLNPSWGIDSGLFVRATDAGQGFQMMVDYLNGGSVGFLYGEQIGGFGARRFNIIGETDSDGSLVSLSARPNEEYEEGTLTFASTADAWLSAWRVNDWNTARVRVEGEVPTITTWINDAKVMEFDAASFEHPRYDREEVARTLGTTGRIALQVHGGADRWPTGAVNRWRNIKVRPL